MLVTLEVDHCYECPHHELIPFDNDKTMECGILGRFLKVYEVAGIPDDCPFS